MESPLDALYSRYRPAGYRAHQGKIGCLFTLAVCSDIDKYLCGCGVVCVRLVVYLMK